MEGIVVTSGKKKTAIARSTIKNGTGRIRINKKPLEILQPEIARRRIYEPLEVAKANNIDISNIDININIRGGGFMGQTIAARTAMARGLIEWTSDERLRDTFINFDRNLLVSDHRKKEAKKFGGRGARARRQKSYR
jgi:small subunit ribosomal protein S9